MKKISEDDLRVIHEVAQHLQQTFTHPESIYGLSLEFAMSVAKLTNLFKQVHGQTIKQFVINIRIEKSKELLRETNDHLPVIANRVGYKDWSAFTRVFRSITGTTPKRYRIKYGNSA